MNIIEKFIKVLERYMDNLSIKKKFIQLYIFCVLLPLIITDSVVLYIVDSMESQRQYHEMANVANAVSYNISALVENAGEIAKSMYTNRRMNTFIFIYKKKPFVFAPFLPRRIRCRFLQI